MKWIIDRFEGNMAVIECGDVCFNVPKDILPHSTSEGDVLNVAIDREETEDKTEQLQKRLNKLFGD